MIQEPDICIEKGNIAFKSCNYHKAIELYTISLSINSVDPSYYNNRAAAYLQIHNYQQALSDCMQAIKINPNYLKSIYRAGLCCLKMGEFNDSVEFFNKANSLDCMNFDCKLMLNEANYLRSLENEYNLAFEKNELYKAREKMNL